MFPFVMFPFVMFPFVQTLVARKFGAVLQFLPPNSQGPPPAAVGKVVALPAQNRSILQALGSTLEVRKAAMKAARMPGRFLWEWVATLADGMFISTWAMNANLGLL